MRNILLILLGLLVTMSLGCTLGSPVATPVRVTLFAPSATVPMLRTGTVPATTLTIVATVAANNTSVAVKTSPPVVNVPPCTPRTDWPQYTVVRGDTLSNIARLTNTSIAVLMQANCITNANSIAVGQILSVPMLPAKTVTPISPPTNTDPASNTPLFIMMRGDLWKWRMTDQVLTKLTTWGYNAHAVMSPNGRKIAYLSVPDMALTAWNSGQMPGEPPTNIWLWDVATDTADRIAEQPIGAVYSPTQSSDVIFRGVPTWSPDGGTLAWVEILPHPDRVEARLVTYSLAMDSVNILVPALNVPYMDAGILTPSIQWGRLGILYQYIDMSQSTQNVILYSPSGAVLSNFAIGSTNSIANMVMLADYNGAEYIFAGNSVTGATVYNINGTRLGVFNGRMNLAASGSNTLAYSDMGNVWQLQWTNGVASPLPALDGAQVLFSGHLGVNLTLAPSVNSGSAAVPNAAYIAGDGVYVMVTGNPVKIPNTEGISLINSLGDGLVWLPPFWQASGVINP